MKIVLTVVGVLLLLAGLLFIGQGSGIVRWPADSFMIDRRPWVVRGAIEAMLGVAMIWYARRR